MNGELQKEQQQLQKAETWCLGSNVYRYQIICSQNNRSLNICLYNQVSQISCYAQYCQYVSLGLSIVQHYHQATQSCVTGAPNLILVVFYATILYCLEKSVQIALFFNNTINSSIQTIKNIGDMTPHCFTSFDTLKNWNIDESHETHNCSLVWRLPINKLTIRPGIL